MLEITIFLVYNVLMTNILSSDISKQFLGAIAGMTIAVAGYFAFQQSSDIRGLLVSTKTIAPSTDIYINAKNADEGELRRIQSQVRNIATAREDAAQPTQAETPLTQLASSRRAARQFSVQLKALSADATTHENIPNTVISQRDRLAIRMENAQRLQAHPAANAVPNISAETNLPNSGFGLNALLIITLVLTSALSMTAWRHRFASILVGVRIG